MTKVGDFVYLEVCGKKYPARVESVNPDGTLNLDVVLDCEAMAEIIEDQLCRGKAIPAIGARDTEDAEK